MKHLFITLCLLSVALFSSAQGEKTALLITHYGSSDPDTRALTLDVITREAKETFPQFEVREAYISPIVRRRLEKQGVHKDSPVDALLKLRSEGYSRVLIQSTTLIEGSEMTSVRRDAESVKPFFKEIKVGNPLLYTVEDCEKVIEILTQEQPGKSTETQERFGFRQESGSAQGQRADGNTAPQGVRPEQPDGRTEPAAGEQSEPYGQAGPVQADPNQDGWWDQSSSGIPGQDMGFFRDEEEQNEDGQDHKDGQNPPQGTVGRFSNTVIPPSDQNH